MRNVTDLMLWVMFVAVVLALAGWAERALVEHTALSLCRYVGSMVTASILLFFAVMWLAISYGGNFSPEVRDWRGGVSLFFCGIGSGALMCALVIFVHWCRM